MLSWFLNMKIKTKVSLSFILMAAILLVVVLVIIQQVKGIEAQTKQVIQLRTPTAQASLMMLNGMNHSLASLRAWVILGEDHFKKERAQAWEQQINPSLEQMKTLSPQWTEAHNVELMKSIVSDLERFRKYQVEIEEIARKEENTPGRKIFIEQVDPLERVVITNISQLIKDEMKIKQTPARKGLVVAMVDFESSMGMAMEKIEEFLLSGQNIFKNNFRENWKNNAHQYNILVSKYELMTQKQKKALTRISDARKSMDTLLKKVVEIRSGEHWNEANFILKTYAAPLSATINQRLNEMIVSQKALLQNDLEHVSRKTHLLIIILVGWFIVGGLISGVLGSTITRGLTGPIESMSETVRGLSEGRLSQKPQDVLSGDEFGSLIKRTNELTDKIGQFRKHAFNLLSGNLKTQEFDLEGDYRRILEDIVRLAKEKKGE